MANLNKVMLIGNLTRDPEIKTTPKGTSIAELGMAINRKWKDDAGEPREEVTFVDVSFFGKTAEVLGKWLKKGAPLYVEGRLKLDQWEDSESGKTRSKLRVIGESFQFLAAAPSEDRDSAPRESARPARPAQRRQTVDEDGIPF